MDEIVFVVILIFCECVGVLYTKWHCWHPYLELKRVCLWCFRMIIINKLVDVLKTVWHNTAPASPHRIITTCLLCVSSVLSTNCCFNVTLSA